MKVQLYLSLPVLLLGFFSLPAQNSLVNMATLSSEFSYEIRYATPDNFIGETLYDCASCLLQPEVAEALLKANQFFCEEGY